MKINFTQLADLLVQTIQRLFMLFMLLGIGFGLGKGTFDISQDAPALMFMSAIGIFVVTFSDMVLCLVGVLNDHLTKLSKKRTESIS